MDTVEVASRPPRTNRLLTISQTAERLAISRATVYRLLDERELTRIRIRSHTRISEADVEDLIARRRAEGA
jgi:excisionase family DNA binding protein